MRRLLTVGAAALGFLVAAVVAVTAYQSLHAPLPPSSDTSLAPENCSPGPCADVQGYTLWLSNINVNGDLVTMQVKFQNSSPSTHAAPEDLQLIDASPKVAPLPKSWRIHVVQPGASVTRPDACLLASIS